MLVPAKAGTFTFVLCAKMCTSALAGGSRMEPCRWGPSPESQSQPISRRASRTPGPISARSHPRNAPSRCLCVSIRGIAGRRPSH
jgi:hypothetical protein